MSQDAAVGQSGVSRGTGIRHLLIPRREAAGADLFLLHFAAAATTDSVSSGSAGAFAGQGGCASRACLLVLRELMRRHRRKGQRDERDSLDKQEQQAGATPVCADHRGNGRSEVHGVAPAATFSRSSVPNASESLSCAAVAPRQGGAIGLNPFYNSRTWASNQRLARPLEGLGQRVRRSASTDRQARPLTMPLSLELGDTSGRSTGAANQLAAMTRHARSVTEKKHRAQRVRDSFLHRCEG